MTLCYAVAIYRSCFRSSENLRPEVNEPCKFDFQSDSTCPGTKSLHCGTLWTPNVVSVQLSDATERMSVFFV